MGPQTQQQRGHQLRDTWSPRTGRGRKDHSLAPPERSCPHLHLRQNLFPPGGQPPLGQPRPGPFNIIS